MTAQSTPATAAPAVDLVTRDGVALRVRPAQPADGPALEAFFDEVSDEDRRFRFLTAVHHVGHDQVAPLVHVDHWQTESYVAFDTATGALVASAMLACDAAMDTGEIAIAIDRGWRGRGLGWALLDMLAVQARRRGLRRVISIEDRENHAAIALEHEKGFVAHAVEGEAHLVLLEKCFG